MEIQKWEYKVIEIQPADAESKTLGHIHDYIVKILDTHGKNGWEVCGCSLQKYILKRPYTDTFMIEGH
jgi:hypothetical protein